ncbi:helix-turn-helix transcriptional regulator [Arthrobacter sp. SX1312]|uniref:helix-turn-helix transcriptional regulator n=1 Tax=Arthrobacter sp. SX1312 TaxID=2058896 RepID=UPI001C6829B8|nr:AraC family transcriptional regulator [Arthrobacter sp. SX1312]
MRRWFDGADRPPNPTWFAADDPVVRAALDHLHAAPSAPWTVETLARRVNTSRASLAARFRTSVGEPPMGYLTRWRLTLAGDLLQTPGVTIAHVARSVGYTDAYSFSTAFKRHVGVTPSEFRRHRPVLAGGEWS